MEGKERHQFRYITQTTREIQVQSNPHFCGLRATQGGRQPSVNIQWGDTYENGTRGALFRNWP